MSPGSVRYEELRYLSGRYRAKTQAIDRALAREPRGDGARLQVKWAAVTSELRVN